MTIYIGGKKDTLIELLENVLMEIRESREGTISVSVYATTTGTLTFSDEHSQPDTLTIEIDEDF